MPIPKSVLVSLLLFGACATIAHPGETAEKTEHKSVLLAQADRPGGGVGLTTSWPGPVLNQGDTISHVLEVSHATSGQRVRIQNSNHGASYFTTPFSAAVQAAVATAPGASATKVTDQQMEITLPAGSSQPRGDRLFQIDGGAVGSRESTKLCARS